MSGLISIGVIWVNSSHRVAEVLSGAPVDQHEVECVSVEKRRFRWPHLQSDRVALGEDGSQPLQLGGRPSGEQLQRLLGYASRNQEADRGNREKTNAPIIIAAQRPPVAFYTTPSSLSSVS